jgi:hypothetical protein
MTRPSPWPRGLAHEAIFSHDDEPGLEVVLLVPNDLDLLEPLHNRRYTVKLAREIVAARRWQERSDHDA